ncbi:ANTAR domain-containing protein [Streptomyces boninensis]|uniref:ANTAR domain-containing protein n=1 Tax=Streptomyces boninensis TaxID=2039455 RepID=UPI003B215BF6
MPLMVYAYDDGDHVVVEVIGDVDLQADQELSHMLQEALDTSAGGVELDLSGVECLDCAGLNILLKIRDQALEAGKSLTLRAASRAALRLFTLTDTLTLFSASAGNSPPGDGGPKLGRPAEDPAPALGSERDPRVEVVQLRRALETRPTIDLARGILMASFALSRDNAWEVLVMVSQNSNTKLHRLADHVVAAVNGDTLPDGLQEHLATAVDTFRSPSADEEPPDLTPAAPS